MSEQKQKKQPIQMNIGRDFFNEKYIPYLQSNNRYQVYYGGSSSGKSHFIATKLVIDLLQQQKKLLVVRQTFATIRESVFAEIIDALARMKILHLVKISQTTLKMEFPNGSEIIFRGADDNGSKLLSIKGIDTCWIEEASEITQDMFHTLETRLRGIGHKKQFYLSFNPISASHWLKSEFFDMPKEDSVICHSTYLDNRFLDEATIKNLLDMKERNPVFYDVYALGKWGTTGKKVFSNWKVEDFELHELVKANNDMKTAIGADFGFINDPSTLICSLVDIPNRKLYIFDELYEKGLLNDEFAQRIIEMGYARQVIIADSAEQKSIEEMRQYGISRIKPARKGGGSINAGIQFIQQFDVIVHPKCVHTIDELENYSYKKDKVSGNYLNQPIDNFNHLLDALRYSLESFNSGGNKVTFLPKSALGVY
ncbi:PBSX family phage terminase large subunit [Sporosarcina beigongshangi]|uniref:PBSX family phage terminase large subunit n=1 Tax=Sporosarcina beigongshangi TaxID=2782538 RepID=UPI00193A4F9B|nr:PBSX family phage terminase large subunit [Sporosarcina beigongshangi]